MNAAELEVLWNRIAIAQARSQRVVDSWLPPTSANSEGEEQALSGADEFDGTDAELGAAFFSDTAGVGYRPSTSTLEDGAFRRSLASNERLRSLLLGSQPGKEGKTSMHVSAGPGLGRPTEQLMGSEPTHASQHQSQSLQSKKGTELSSQSGRKGSKGWTHATKKTASIDSGDDEDLGRSAIGRKRQKS